MPKYRKKPVVIEAAVYIKGMENGYKVIETDYPEDGTYFVTKKEFNAEEQSIVCPAIKTLEGWIEISDGDYIITGVKGERYPCKPDVFELTYDLVSEEE